MIIANTTPLINFAMIGQLELLHSLFGQLTIPRAVIQELEDHQDRYPDVLTMVQQSGFFDVLDVQHTALHDVLLLDLDSGESEAIALAVEHHAELIILDEIAGRYVAEAQQLLFIGSIGCLIEAKRVGLIQSIRPAIDEMRQSANFWVRDALYERILRDQDEWSD